MKFNYREDLIINRDALDQEWLHQSDLYMEYADLLADAKFAMDRAKSKLEKHKAVLLLNVRKNPDKYNMDKVTEATVTSAVIADETTQQLEKELNRKRYAVTQLTHAEIAFQSRKSALTKLTELHMTGYYSEPVAQMPRARTNEIRQSSTSTKVAGRLKRRNKE